MYEDLFSENLVDEPADIERVIEGDERGRFSGNESDRGDNENKSDQEENNDKDGNKDNDKKPKVRKSFGPRVVLNAERLIGPRGISIMESFFSDIKLQGKGKEKEDLEVVMKRLELWSHRLAPRFHFEDSLKKIEKLGSKKIVQTHLKIARYGRNDDVGVARGLAEEVPDSPPPPPPPEDPFDQLLASSAPPSHSIDTDITAEQREQMLRNRLIAEERRAARIKKAQEMKQRFLVQRNSQSQPTDMPLTEIINDLNNQTERSSEEPTVAETQAEEDSTQPTPSEETNKPIDPVPLHSPNPNAQVHCQDSETLTLQNEDSVNETTDTTDQDSNTKNYLVLPIENVDMEEDFNTSTSKQFIEGGKFDEHIESADIEMDLDVPNSNGKSKTNEEVIE